MGTGDNLRLSEVDGDAETVGLKRRLTLLNETLNLEARTLKVATRSTKTRQERGTSLFTCFTLVMMYLVLLRTYPKR